MAALSFRWQFWGGAELNRGPSPSEASVETARDPVLAEDAVADLEFELALEIYVAGGQREGIGREVLPEVAPPPGFSSPGSSLEVRRGSDEALMAASAPSPWV
jgi:hypothetical protein